MCHSDVCVKAPARSMGRTKHQPANGAARDVTGLAWYTVLLVHIGPEMNARRWAHQR